jgi:hypothetical protein
VDNGHAGASIVPYSDWDNYLWIVNPQIQGSLPVGMYYEKERENERAKKRKSEKAKKRKSEKAKKRKSEKAKKRKSEKVKMRKGEKARRREGEKARRREGEKARMIIKKYVSVLRFFPHL